MVRSSKGHGNQTIGTAARLVSTAIGVLVFIAALIGAYYSILGNINEIRIEQRQTNKTLESLAASINKLAEEAVNEERLRSFCLSAALANNGKWICPLSGVQQQMPHSQPVRRAVRSPAAVQ